MKSVPLPTGMPPSFEEPTLLQVSTLGAVLGGGQSTRMGSDKALIEVDGVSMLERVTTAVASAAHRVVILGTEYEGFESWPDQAQGAGPLIGIATALARAEADRVLVVAVDHPFVRSETLARLVGMEAELSVVPVDKDGVRQVTCAVYPVSIADLAAEEAGAGGSIQSLLDRVSFQPVTPDTWTAWGEDGRSWFSADTPDAVEDGVTRFLGV